MQNKLALVVDDSRVARMTLSKLLHANNFDVVEMPSGEEALDYLYSTQTKPGIVFMDVMMGGMDGLEATQKIKAESTLQTMPVVICTGNDAEADIEKAMATGAVAVLSKPPVAEQLAEILAAVPSSEEVIDEPPLVAIDEAALVAKVISAIEQDLLIRTQQQAREMAEDISRQIAEDTAEKVAKEQVKAETEAMLPAMTEQISQVVTGVAEETAHRVCKVVANESIAKNAEQAVQRAVHAQGLTEKIAALLSNEGGTWLQRQEQQLHKELSQKVEQIIAPNIDEYLQENLPPKVGPIVHAAVQEAITSLDVAEKEEAFLLLAKRVTILNRVVIGLGVMIVGLIVIGNGFYLN
ncbi:MAG: response regulator [Proteobacteria bacterium]|nr:response regulator [Pseudomonadota bacterium]